MRQTGILVCVLYIVIATIRYGSASNCESKAYQVCNPTTFSNLRDYKDCWLATINDCYDVGTLRSENDCNIVEVPQTQELCWEEEYTTVQYSAFICVVY